METPEVVIVLPSGTKIECTAKSAMCRIRRRTNAEFVYRNLC
jgi:hypothetical protein